LVNIWQKLAAAPALNDSFLNCLTLEQLESSLECVGTVLSLVVVVMACHSCQSLTCHVTVCVTSEA